MGDSQKSGRLFVRLYSTWVCHLLERIFPPSSIECLYTRVLGVYVSVRLVLLPRYMMRLSSHGGAVGSVHSVKTQLYYGGQPRRRLDVQPKRRKNVSTAY